MDFNNKYFIVYFIFSCVLLGYISFDSGNIILMTIFIFGSVSGIYKIIRDL